MMGVAFYLIWKQAWQKKKVRESGQYFLAQLAFNFSWSSIFFGLRSPLLGLITIGAMWILILITLKKFYSLSKYASYLLVPYMLRVSFATLLNAAIVLLN